MDPILKWLSGNALAMYLLVGLVAVAVLVLIVLSVVAFFQGREIRVWGLVITHGPGNGGHAGVASTAPRAEEYLREPVLVSSAARNPQKVVSDFLLRQQGTIMLWVEVPLKGRGLREAPDNRYLLAHHTGDRPNGVYLNAFALRYSAADTWDLFVSNGRGEPKQLSIEDGLEPGWHHFMVAWDHTKPQLALLVDKGKGGMDLSKSYAASWPQAVGENVSVGAWVSPYPTGYCETRLCGLVVVASCLNATDPLVREQTSKRPPV